MSDPANEWWIEDGPELAAGYWLAELTGPGGVRWPILDDVRIGDGAPVPPHRPDQFYDIAPHELTGPLPERFRARLNIEEDA